MYREITLGDRIVKMRCSALVPRLYRRACNRDLIRDMSALRESYNAALRAAHSENEEERKKATLSVVDLEIFENLAWSFCKDADRENIPDTPDEWLDSFSGMFSIYEIFPEMVKLWNDSNVTTSTPAKKAD